MLTYTGVETLKYQGSHECQKRKRKTGFLQNIRRGIFISLSNPLSILFWLGIYGGILAKTAESFDANQLLIYSSGILLGILIWDFCMAVAASTFRNLLHEKALRWLTGAAGVSLIVFGFYFGWQGIQMLIS